MSEIDRRIVEMQFDNDQFEKGIKTSVKSLEDLKKSLELEDAAKSLSKLEKEASKFSLSGLGQGIETLTHRFSTMGIAGMAVINRLTNAAINAGKNMLESLTIAPIKTGMAEYETQIGSIQTILANTSKWMDQNGYSEAQALDMVNSKLEELNLYADQTIYNFTEMANNIGRFTAAGVELNTSVDAIKGIANLAALSGSNSQQATHAMVQLSQAISAGTVRAQDWMSVTNAGMGGKIFQDALIDRARVAGVAIDDLIAKKGDFKSSLSEGWLSSDILLDVLNDFAFDAEAVAKLEEISKEQAIENKKIDLIAKGYSSDQADAIIKQAEEAKAAAQEVKTFTQLISTLQESAQSGWTQSWQNIIGDFDEAKELLTKMSKRFGDIIGASAESRNAMLKDWKDLGGRDMLIDSFWNVVDAVENVAKLLRSSFEEIFPPMTGERLASFTEKIKSFTERIKAFTQDSEKMGKVKRIFDGIAAAVDIVKTAIGWLWGGFKKLLGVSEPVGDSFLDLFAGIGDFIAGVRDAIKNSETFQSILSAIGGVITTVKNFVVGIGKSIWNVFGKIVDRITKSGLLTKIGDKLTIFFGAISKGIGKIKDWGKSIFEAVKNSKTLKSIWEKIKNVFGPIVEKVSAFFGGIWNGISSFFNADTTGEGGLLGKIKKRFESFFGGFENPMDKASKAVQSAKKKLDGVWQKIFGPKDEKQEIGMDVDVDSESWFTKIKNKVLDIWEKVKAFLTTFFTETVPKFFTETVPNFINSLPDQYTKLLEQVKAIDWGKIVTPLISIFAAYELASLVQSLNNFSQVGKLFKSTGKQVKNIGEALSKSLKGLTKVTVTRKNKDSVGNNMLKTAAAIALVAAAIVVLGRLYSKEKGNIENGLKLIGAIGLVLVGINLVTAIKPPGDTSVLLKTAGAIALVATAVWVLGNMNAASLEQGKEAMVLIAAILMGFTALTAQLGGTVNIKGLVGMAFAMLLLVAPIFLLGNMNQAKLGQGMEAIGLILAVVALFKRVDGVGKEGALKGLVGMAFAMLLLVAPIFLLGNMKQEVLRQGMEAIGLILAAVALFKRVDGVGKEGALKGMIGMAAAMLLLTVPIIALGLLPLPTLAKGVGAVLIIMSVLSIMTVIAGAAKGVPTGIIALAAAVTLLAIPVIALGLLPIGALAKGVGAVVILMAAVTVMTAILGSIKSSMKDVLPTLVIFGALAAMMVVFSLVVASMAGVPWEVIAAFSAGLAVLLPAMAVTAKLLSKIGIGAAVKAAAVMAILAAGIGAGLTILLGFIGGGMESFGESLFIFGSCMKAFSDMAASVDNDAMGSAMQSMEELAAFATKVSISDTSKLEKFTKQLPLIGARFELLSMSTKKIDAKGMDNAKKIVESIDDISTMVRSLESSGIDIGTLDNKLTNLGSAMQLYAAAVSKANGLMPEGGTNENVDAALKSMYEDLANAAPDSGTVAKISSYADGNANSLTDFAHGIVALGNAMESYEASTKNLTEGGITKSGYLISMLTKLQNELPIKGEDGEFYDEFGNKKQTLADFGTSITTLGNGVSSFAASVSGISQADVNYTTHMLGVLDELEKGLTTDNGDSLSGVLFGKNSSLAEFGSHIQTLGDGLSKFMTNVKDFGSEQTVGQINAITNKSGPLYALVEMQGMLGRIGGLASLLAGTNDLGTFGDKLVVLGEKFREFINVTIKGTGDIESPGLLTLPDNMDAITNVITEYAGLARMMAGVKNVFPLDEFIKKIGEDIDDFSKKTKGVDASTIAPFGEFVNNVAQAAVASQSVDDTSLSNLQALLNSMGMLTFPELKTDGSEEALAFIAGFSSEFQNGLSPLTESGTSLVDEFLKGITGALPNVVITATKLSYNVSDTVTNDPDSNLELLNAGAYVAGKFAEGLLDKTKTELIEGNAKELSWAGSDAAQEEKEVLPSWKTAGANAGQGFIDGITSMLSNAAIAGKNLSIAALNATTSALDEHSPSREMYKVGEYFDLGFVNAINDYAYLADRASEDMAQGSLDNMRDMLSSISRIAVDDLDTTPTIRPVLDLSDISHGMSTMDGMLRADRSINAGLFSSATFNRNAAKLNLDGGRMAGTSDNKDVVSAIDALTERFNNLSEAVTGMQLVLDTGTLVGQLDTKIDKQLGVLAGRRNRGN